MGDIHDRSEKLEAITNKLENSTYSKQNTEKLLQFKYYLEADNDVGIERESRYLSAFNTMEKLIDFSLENADKTDLVRLVGKLNRDNWDDKDRSPYTINEYRKALKKFYKWEKDSDNPEIVDFISCYVKKKDRPQIEIEDLPTPQDVKRIMNACQNPRDKCFILLLWETGGRISEVLNLKWKDHKELENYSKLKFRHSKTLQRSVPVKDCVPLLETWKLYHKDPSPEEYIFTNIDSLEQVKYRNMMKQRENAVEAIGGIDRRTNFHAFRKSRASYLASNGWNIFQLMRFFGWDDPETALHYIKLARSNVEDAFLRTYRQSQVGDFSDEDPDQVPEPKSEPYSKGNRGGEIEAVARVF